MSSQQRFFLLAVQVCRQAACQDKVIFMMMMMMMMMMLMLMLMRIVNITCVQCVSAGPLGSSYAGRLHCLAQK